MSCPACGGAEYRPEFTEWQPTRAMTGAVASYEACWACGLVARRPRPDALELRSYYETAWQFSEPRPVRCAVHAAAFIAAHMGSEPVDAIDIGAKSSGFLDVLQERGLPLSMKHTIDAQPVAAGTRYLWFGEGVSLERRYGLVVATHILEHVRDPRQFMEDVTGCMTVGGLAYIEVPSLEIGHQDISACDDINPNHLWHFTLQSLAMLASSVGLQVVALSADDLAAGWPCNRLLVRAAPTWIVYGRDKTEAAYKRAAALINGAWHDGDALYGASFSCWRLLSKLGPRIVVDLYKTGQIQGSSIISPSALEAAGIKRVWLTPRFWNSQKEIGAWLRDNYPGIEVLCPYPDLIDA